MTCRGVTTHFTYLSPYHAAHPVTYPRILTHTHKHTQLPWGYRTLRIGQNRIYTPYMTIYLVISLSKIPYVHRINMVLANPKHTPPISSPHCSPIHLLDLLTHPLTQPAHPSTYPHCSPIHLPNLLTHPLTHTAHPSTYPPTCLQAVRPLPSSATSLALNP